MVDRIELSRICIPLLPSQSQAKRKGAGARTWLVVSKSGKISFEELGKNTVMRRSGITAHDLRVVEPELSYPSAVLRRESAVVVNLEHIKAIVTANEVLVPNPRDPRIASFVYDLESKLSDFGAMKHRLSREKGWAITNPNQATITSDKAMEQSLTYMPPEASGSKRKASNGESKRLKPKPLPFEFRALEICLESVCKGLESETSTLEEEAYPALDQLSAKTKTNNLKRVRVIKGRLVALTGRVQKVRNEFEHLLDDDTDMAQMYLTDKLATLQTEGLVPEDEIDDAYTFLSGDHINEETSSKSSTVDLKPNVEEVEMLLGAYFVEIEGILNKLSTEYVHDTEDYINIVLDDKQNQLLRMGLFISTASFMVTLAVVAIGFMSINIHIDLFDGAYNQWYAAFGGCSVGSVVLYIIVILVFKWLRLFG